MKTVLIVLLGSMGYATLRYNVFKGVSWEEWPVYVLNKALSLAALLLLATHVFQRRRGGASSNSIMTGAWVFAMIHVGISVVILNPAYFPALFADGKLTAVAGLSILLGTVALACFHSRLLEVPLLAFLVSLHAACFGGVNWFTPTQWPGYMPPITLVSFVVGVAVLAIRFGSKSMAAGAK